MPTGSNPSAEDEDSLLILKETMSDETSLIQRAENSITPIISVLLECVASSLIDLIDCGVEYETGSDGAVVVHVVPL